MPVARKHIVAPKLTPWYHCISRCVRRAFFCVGGAAHRKDWIEASKVFTPSHVACRTRLESLFHGTFQAAYKKARLEFLSQVFAVNVGPFSAMDIHLHLLLRLNREQAESLSAEEVARRWGVLCPPRDGNRQPMAITAGWIKRKAQDRVWVETTRERLGDLSWFMKFLKDPIARQANAEDKVTSAFWEGRFKSVAILDETSLLATMAYIVLTPEAAPHTSIKARIDRASAHSAPDGGNRQGCARHHFILEPLLWYDGPRKLDQEIR